MMGISCAPSPLRVKFDALIKLGAKCALEGIFADFLAQLKALFWKKFTPKDSHHMIFDGDDVTGSYLQGLVKAISLSNAKDANVEIMLLRPDKKFTHWFYHDLTNLQMTHPVSDLVSIVPNKSPFLVYATNVKTSEDLTMFKSLPGVCEPLVIPSKEDNSYFFHYMHLPIPAKLTNFTQLGRVFPRTILPRIQLVAKRSFWMFAMENKSHYVTIMHKIGRAAFAGHELSHAFACVFGTSPVVLVSKNRSTLCVEDTDELEFMTKHMEELALSRNFTGVKVTDSGLVSDLDTGTHVCFPRDGEGQARCDCGRWACYV